MQFNSNVFLKGKKEKKIRDGMKFLDFVSLTAVKLMKSAGNVIYASECFAKQKRFEIEFGNNRLLHFLVLQIKYSPGYILVYIRF